MKECIDITGEIFGILTAAERVDNIKNRIAYLCLCECGANKIILKQSLISGATQSCGCTKHLYDKPVGGYDVDLYKLWHTMIRRCDNKKTNGYHRYGGRGISVCSKWKGKRGFVSFVEDMGERPSIWHSIDRIDNDGGYCKENCRWATKKEQANKRHNCHYITIDGVTKTLSQWSEITGTNYQTISERINRGWEAKIAVYSAVR